MSEARKTIVITGASDGIGAAAARSLAADNDVIIVGRSPAKTEAVAETLGVPHYLADFSRFDEVRNLADHLLQRCERIDVLANNAGLLAGRREVTKDGHELTFQVNHLSSFLLTMLLKQRLVESKARVINTSSAAHQMARPSLASVDKPTWTWKAYANSKLANVLFANELHRRWHEHGVLAASFHPGVIVSGFARANRVARALYASSFAARVTQTVDEGAATLCWLATAPELAWTSGGYYYNMQQQRLRGPAASQPLAEDLWNLSLRLTATSD